MVGKDDLRAIRDEQVAIHLHATLAQGSHFLEKRQGIEYHAVANDVHASRTKNSARHQLQDKFLSLDDDGVAGIVPAGVPGYDRESLGEYIDNFAFAFVTPLG